MNTEQKISELEIKIQEQEGLINELFKIAVEHQQMINERVTASTATQTQLNEFMKNFLRLYKK